MRIIQGTAITARGASNTHLSVDFGTFAVTAESGVLEDPVTERRVSPGFVRLEDNPDGTRNEWPATVSWGLDGLGRATEVGAEGTNPNGEPFTMRTTGERETGEARRSKWLDGTLTVI